MSFKTNVNRAKTKKWVQAKKNAYDGDDWGDYDTGWPAEKGDALRSLARVSL